ncbi:hypothetical protein HYC85_026554 [Camellia sinensis]|uniref:Uncharacterized protein n=1 Tax=Camellia sinensis TaxID=4442 RepID=A0A7J7G552_CAMSI|nr:hypothetical protein HYC85_026554 [Camellia sinensis]
MSSLLMKIDFKDLGAYELIVDEETRDKFNSNLFNYRIAETFFRVNFAFT